MNSRLIHYRIALLFSVFILITTITGLLWAYAPYLYWKDGYKTKKVALSAPVLPGKLFGFDQLASLADFPAKNFQAIELRAEAGLWVFEVKDGKQSWLLDAVTGRSISPLSEENARLIGNQYLPAGTSFISAELISNWVDRKDLKFGSAWLLRAGDSAKTEIVLDANSGAILEDSDTIRRFHFWVMKLHQFKFLGTHKELTAVSGVPLLVLLLSGLILGWKRWKAQSRGSKKAQKGNS